jgi:hypothetical protein
MSHVRERERRQQHIELVNVNVMISVARGRDLISRFSCCNVRHSRLPPTEQEDFNDEIKGCNAQWNYAFQIDLPR